MNPAENYPTYPTYPPITVQPPEGQVILVPMPNYNYAEMIKSVQLIFQSLASRRLVIEEDVKSYNETVALLKKHIACLKMVDMEKEENGKGKKEGTCSKISQWLKDHKWIILSTVAVGIVVKLASSSSDRYEPYIPHVRPIEVKVVGDVTFAKQQPVQTWDY